MSAGVAAAQTLADRMLELAGNIPTDLKGNKQVLDNLEVRAPACSCATGQRRRR